MEHGKTVWLLPDCYYPADSTEGPYVSHEAVCVLNATENEAHIHMTLFFEDDEPVDDFYAVCGARRTNHIRLDSLKSAGGRSIPKGRGYAMLLESNVPIVCQYSRVDTTQERLGLATTIPYAP